MLDDPAQQVMEDAGSWNITVRHMDGKALYYFNDNEINLNGAEIVVTRLTREVMKKDESFVVYTDPEGIPAALLTILQELGVDYEERPYQLLLRTR